jgi:catechol 2,3-dioxygenase-like lactoylglutathione lyase family enzyme
MQFHRGRLIDHVHLDVADLQRSAVFYAAVLEAIGHEPGSLTPHFFQVDELFISQPGPGQALSHVHLAFQAADHDMVARFHAAAIAAGGTDNGGPGERPYHPGYYGAFVLDPDGNNIEAVFHGPSTRSADSVVITAT